MLCEDAVITGLSRSLNAVFEMKISDMSRSVYNGQFFINNMSTHVDDFVIFCNFAIEFEKFEYLILNLSSNTYIYREFEIYH